MVQNGRWQSIKEKTPAEPPARVPTMDEGETFIAMCTERGANGPRCCITITILPWYMACNRLYDNDGFTVCEEMEPDRP